jgi:hypothetical protein
MKTSNHNASVITPCSEGLIIVQCEPAHLAHVRGAITCVAAEGSSNIGIPMPPNIQIHSLLSGNLRRKEQAKLIDKAYSSEVDGPEYIYKNFGTRENFNFLGDECSSSLFPYIKNNPKCWIIFEQNVTNTITLNMQQSLFRIRNEAKKIGNRVMLFVATNSPADVAGLDQCGNEYFAIAPCEPDEGDELAFSVDCPSLSNLNLLGIGKKQCNVKQVGGKLICRYTNFVSSSKLTRIMWALVAQGESFEKIGKLLSVNKSTVSRRLAGLPSPKKIAGQEDWLKHQLASVSITHDDNPTSSSTEPPSANDIDA